MRAFFFLFTIVNMLCICTLPAQAQGSAMVVDLDRDHVDITTGFDGSDIVLFGERPPGSEVAIVMLGPERNMTVRRKKEILGIWMNAEYIVFGDVPAFYDYALSTPKTELLPEETRIMNKIGLNALEFERIDGNVDSSMVNHFEEALIRNKQAEALYPLRPREIRFLSERLFRTEFHFPANVAQGEYQILTYLVRGEEVIKSQTTTLQIGQIGFSAQIYELAHQYGVFYGMICIMIALMAGYGINLLIYRR